MYKSIKSSYFDGFNCCVNAKPVLEYSDFTVYELVNSSFPNDIIKKVNGRVVGVFRHVAIDENNIGYLFDFSGKSLSGSVGKCDLL